MAETSDYRDLDLYNQSPSTVGKQNQIISALDDLSIGGSQLLTAINDLADGIAIEITGRDEIKSAVISCGAGASATVVDISALGDYIVGDYIRVIGWYITAGTASGSYVWKSAATAMTGVCMVGINGGVNSTQQFDCAPNEDLVITTVASTIEGIVNYVLVHP